MTDPGDTRGRLVDAAERLFVEGGEEATSLRAIARAAHANPAAVHYHFGGRDELLRAVFDRQLGPLAARRLALVEQTPPGDITALVFAALRCDVELLAALRRQRADLARFLGRTALNLPAASAVPQWCGPSFSRYLVTRLRAELPEHRAAELAQRVRMAYTLVFGLFATADSDPDPEPVEPGLRRLAAFVAGGLTAPAAGRSRKGPPVAGKGTPAGKKGKKP